MKKETVGTNLIDNYPSLSIALVKLLNNQEKDWGYFQVKKEDRYSVLSTPCLPVFRLEQNEQKQIYRGYWGRDEKPSIEIKKRQRMMFVIEKQRKKEKKQRIYEVLIKQKPDSIEGMGLVNKCLAILIRDRIEKKVSYVAIAEEIKPIVTITESFNLQ
ncbi:MAG: hypothetical protein QNJ54_09580 [Prochloraceae cyanobacterium]|nr:hypothetical protein [Prochloraceae cyanobacterium]